MMAFCLGMIEIHMKYNVRYWIIVVIVRKGGKYENWWNCIDVNVLMVLWCLKLELGTCNLDDYVYVVFSLTSWWNMKWENTRWMKYVGIKTNYKKLND